MKKLTRNQRRLFRRNADKVAAVLAAATMGADGKRFTDPRGVLREGFAAMLRNDCLPVVHRLTAEQAASLPGYCTAPAGAQWFAAFGLDVDRYGTWVSRWARVNGLPPDEARDLIEVQMLRDLAVACNVSGLPVEARR